jgi:hypothetical protein
MTEKGTHYGVDAKYAGSPRDLNPPAKKKLVPSLKIEGITKDQLARLQNIETKAPQPGEQQGNHGHTLDAANPKMQIIIERKKHHDDYELINKNVEVPIEELLTENLFYYSERKLRNIYEDDELHVQVLTLMISLLLTPTRGTLDDHYTSQYPVDDGKPNILYIMHFHLNHPSNHHILPALLRKSSEVNPYPAGQRLLKLLCISFSDLSIYTDRKKIGGGAYGTIYECKTNLADP